jgi:hypothetical protein
MNTRLDIGFAVGYASRFIQEPYADHLVAVKHILRYLSGTSALGVFYPRGKGDEAMLSCCCDSDLAGDIDGRKSTLGMIFFLGESLVSWQSAK